MLPFMLVLGVAWVAGGFAAYLRLRKTRSERVARRILLAASTVLAIIVTIMAALAAFAQSVYAALPTFLGCVVVAAELWLLGSWPRRKKLAGKVLLETGRADHFRRHVAAGLTMVAGGVLAGVSTGTLSASALLLAGLGILAAPVIVLEADTGTKITERGILRFQRFEPWQNILTWTWATDQEGVIVTTH